MCAQIGCQKRGRQPIDDGVQWVPTALDSDGCRIPPARLGWTSGVEQAFQPRPEWTSVSIGFHDQPIEAIRVLWKGD